MKFEHMNYNIEVNYLGKFIRYKHVGTIKRSEIGAVWDQLLQTPEFTDQGFNLLSDYSEGKFDFTIEDLDPIDEFLSAIKHILKGKKNAVVVNNPNDTIISLMFESKTARDIGFRVKVFSTLEAAYRFLHV